MAGHLPHLLPEGVEYFPAPPRRDKPEEKNADRLPASHTSSADASAQRTPAGSVSLPAIRGASSKGEAGTGSATSNDVLEQHQLHSSSSPILQRRSTKPLFSSGTLSFSTSRPSAAQQQLARPSLSLSGQQLSLNAAAMSAAAEQKLVTEIAVRTRPTDPLFVLKQFRAEWRSFKECFYPVATIWSYWDCSRRIEMWATREDRPDHWSVPAPGAKKNMSMKDRKLLDMILAGLKHKNSRPEWHMPLSGDLTEQEKMERNCNSAQRSNEVGGLLRGILISYPHFRKRIGRLGTGGVGWESWLAARCLVV